MVGQRSVPGVSNLNFSATAAGILICLAGLHAQTPALQVTTIPVNPAFGAEALQSCGLAVDRSGTIYAGLFDATLRRIGPDGTMTLVAGAPNQSGTVDGAGGAARLNANMGLAVDAAGIVYICELSGAIRRVTPDGIVTTIAGAAGAGGYADGTGSAARFNGATRICLDPTSGNLYVADTFNHVIRKVTPSGAVTTIAGQPGVSGLRDGDAGSALFTAPAAITCDAAGNIYVADYSTSGTARVGRIRKVAPAGSVSTLADGLASGIELAVDASGNCYAAGVDSKVVEVSPSGGIAVVAGVQNITGDADGLGVYSTLTHPVSIAAAPNGTLVIGTWDALRLGAPVLAPPTAPKFVKLTGLPPDAPVPGGPLVLSVLAVGYPAPSYQWFRNGAAVGAPGPSLAFPLFESSDDGAYTVVASNGAGSVTSPSITLTYVAPNYDPRAGPPPLITMQPVSQSVSAGGNATFTVAATGAAAYEWAFNGAIIPGATGPSLTLSQVGPSQSGTYVAAATSATGVVTWSSPVTLTITTGSSAAIVQRSQLVNISTRALVGSGAQALVAGFSISGSGGKTLLVRGIGPSLASFGVTAPLPQPQLTLTAPDGTTLAAGGAWGGGSALASLMSQVGAFALPPGSADSAVETTVPAGSYTAEVSGAGGSTGTALAEVFDGSPGSPARIVNLSARGFAGSASSALVAGFVVSGAAGETLLIRGIGPGLAAYGVPGTLPTTRISLFDSHGQSLATNTGWDGSSSLATLFAQVGAFALSPGSADSALVVSLPPGAYTVELSGAAGESGVGLVELYEAP